MKSATCPHCFKIYTNTSPKNRHISRKIHPSEVQVQVQYCPPCVDEVKQEEEKPTFLNLEEFENRTKFEYRNVDYITNRTWKENCKTANNNTRDEEAKNEELENFCINKCEEKLKLREVANEFLEEKCQDLNIKEENIIDVETYKNIFFKNLANDIKLDLPDFKKLAAHLTSVVRQFQGSTPTKRKMEKQTYYPQLQKKQRKE